MVSYCRSLCTVCSVTQNGIAAADEGALFLFLHAYLDVGFPLHTHLNAKAAWAVRARPALPLGRFTCSAQPRAKCAIFKAPKDTHA